MCGRFTLTASVRDLATLFDTTEGNLPEVHRHYNIPPTVQVLAVRQFPDQEGRQLVALRWVLIPSWAKDPAIGNRLINARADTAADKPSIRSAFRRRRCLILADGFFEWKKEGRTKQPYYIRPRDGKPFAFAGLWECWHNPEDKPVETCTILTTHANDLMRPIHHRMPVILETGAYASWLDPLQADPAKVLPLLGLYTAEQMTAFPVSRCVNDPRHDDPKCLEPLGGTKPPSAIRDWYESEKPQLFDGPKLPKSRRGHKVGRGGANPR
jgi:putative SOS response-associated peptidase YedK